MGRAFDTFLDVNSPSRGNRVAFSCVTSDIISLVLLHCFTCVTTLFHAAVDSTDIFCWTRSLMAEAHLRSQPTEFVALPVVI